MSSPDYVLCKWKRRLWPAKVLSKAATIAKDELMDVEILCLDEQIQVTFKDTTLLEKAEVEKIAAKLAHRTKSSEATVEELTYRKALRIALDILNQRSALGISTPTHGGNSAKTCKEPQLAEKIINEKKGCQKSLETTAKQSKTPEKKCDGKSSKKHLCVAINNGDSSEVPKPSRTRDVPLVNDKTRLPEKKRKRTKDSSVHDEEGDAAAGRRSQKGKSANERPQDSACKNSSIAKECAVKAECDGRIAHGHEENGNTGKKQQEKRLAIHNSCQEHSNKAHSIRKAVSESKRENCDTDKERVDLQQEKRCKLLPMPDFEDERGLSSSELSMEISSPETCTSKLPLLKEYPDEDEDLPSLLNQGPSTIKAGMFAWCKFQKYPYWPAVVKCVHQKARKASILFVEESLSDPKHNSKSFLVLQRTLKLYDCPEKKELLEKARKNYGNSIDWCDAVISDYRIRVGCGFSGSFTEYCTAAISLPVRNELLHGKAGMLFPSLDPVDATEAEVVVTPSKSQQNKKTLPDRARAARDRANERLVDFIAKTKQAENHLLDILSGKKKSRWLQDFLASNKHTTCIDTYMEDEEQVELVVGYLQTLCEHMDEATQKLVNKDRMRFVLDVLLPEAVIFAISATDEINYKKAEKKYLDGPSISKRERNMFEEQIIEKKKLQDLEKQGAKNESD